MRFPFLRLSLQPLRVVALSTFGLATLATSPATAQNLQDPVELEGVWAGDAAWGDYDDDGDQDLALIGESLVDSVCVRIAKIYRNVAGSLAEDLAQTPRLEGTYFGDLGWADYDGDGDLDLAIAGWDSSNVEGMALYLNTEGFTGDDRLLTFDIDQVDDQGQSNFVGVRYAALAWVDYDNDGDIDLVVSGMDSTGTSQTRVYVNDEGILHVDEVNSEALINVHNGDLAWADYDSDGDLDLVISGDNVVPDGGIEGRVTEFYANDPVGSLTLNTSLDVATKVNGGSLAWGDYNGDGNPDLAVSGTDAFWVAATQLYTNRPAGSLSLDTNFELPYPWDPISGGLDWIDYDNDGDIDLAIAGRDIQSRYRTLVFGNDGGVVTAGSAEVTLDGVAGGASVWGDADGDLKSDLLVMGVDETGQRRTILYRNRGTPNANVPPTVPPTLRSVEVTSSRVVFNWAPASDVEGSALSYNIRIRPQGAETDIMSGAVPFGPGNAGTKTSFTLHRPLIEGTYFWSVESVDAAYDTSGFSAEAPFVVERFVSSDENLRDLSESSMAWGDFDDDGDQDLAIMGQNRSGDAQSLVYINRAGSLSLDLNAGLQPLQRGDLSWGDYDSDGDLDLFTTGEDSRGNRDNLLYRTDLSGTEEAEFSFALRFRPELNFSSTEWGDVDNDGDLDLLLMGQSNLDDGERLLSFTHIWVNDGDGGFELGTFELTGLNNGEGLLGDVDGDGDLDLMAVGVDSQEEPQAKLYRNLLPDGFRDMGLAIPGMTSADIAFGDFDQDGDIDLAAGGNRALTSTTDLFSGIYTNDGAGGFETIEDLEDLALPGIQGGDLAWADFDNDQDLDLIVSGNAGDDGKLLRIYENTIGRTGSFSSFELANLTAFQGVDFSSVSMADIGDDGDLDLISAGKDATSAPSTTINDNLITQQPDRENRVPTAPSLLQSEDIQNQVTLSWEPGSDDRDPPTASLGYNVRVGTTANGNDVLSGAFSTGIGNTGHKLNRVVRNLTDGTYYWSVQTVDAGAARSEWRDGEPFIIDTVAPRMSEFALNSRVGGVGLGQTVSLGIVFFDDDSGIDSSREPSVVARIGGSEHTLTRLQFTGSAWSGELSISSDMPSGEATLNVSGVVDQKGNALSDTTFGLFDVDTDLPLIVSQQPVAEAIDVAQTTSEVSIEFSEALDPGSVAAENFTVILGNSAIPLRVEQPADTSATVTLILEEELRPGSHYDVQVSAAIQDLAANRPADAISWGFDTRIPQLTATVPENGDTEVALDDGRLRATFDAGLDLSTLEGAIEILREEQVIELRDVAVFDEETNTLSFEIAEGLLPGSRYRVVLSGLLAGPLGAVSQGDLEWRFTTAVPQVSSLTPVDGDTTVSVADDGIRAVFDQRLDPVAALTAGNIRITEQGSPIEAGDVDYNADTGALSFSPADGLKAGTRYAVTIDGSAGGPLRQEEGHYSWSFSTAVPLLEETAPPAGAIVSTADLTAATAQFSVPLDDDQVNPANFILLREGSAVSLREGDPVVLAPGLYGFAAADGWKVGSSYAISVATSVQGPLGPGQVLGWQFQTTVPDTISVNPAAGADDVEVSISGITAVFDDLIDVEALQTAGNVVLAREGLPIEITDPIGYDPDSGVVTIPVSDLSAGSSYQVLLAADIAGPRAPGEFRWGFSTSIPTLVSTTPPDGSSIAAGPRRIELVFSSAVDDVPARDPSNYRLSSGGESIDLAGAEFLYEEGDLTVSLPEFEFLSGTGYEVVVSSRLGGPRAQRPDDEFSFATDLPMVLESSPDDAAQGVTTSTAAIRLLFSGPVARGQVEGFQLRARPVEEALVDAAAPFGLLSIAGFGLDPTGSEINFAPEGGFQPFTEYQVIVDPSVFGQLAIDGFTLEFTTAARVGNTADGGTISSADRSVELYFPPNALSGGQDGEVLIQPLEAANAARATQATLTQVGQAWQIDGLGGNLMKPVTLTMRYTTAELDGRDATRLGIFKLDGTEWVRIGGTADPAAAQVRTTVEDFGAYALFEDLHSQVGALALAGIDVQPQAFAPAGGRGNMRQETDISFDLSGPADVTVRVYSASGRLERVVARDTPMGQGRNSLVWDGRDEDRKTVGSGLYIVVISAGDEQAEKVVAVVR